MGEEFVWGRPVQWDAPVPNDVHWYIIMGVILAASALLVFGVSQTFERWEAEAEAATGKSLWWLSLVGALFGITQGHLLGALLGHLVWHWGLGLAAGGVGAWASTWVMTYLNRLVKKWIKNGNGKTSKEGGDSKSPDS